MSEGPAMVAVQLRRFSGEEGNAEIPGVLESINCINSVWRLETCQFYVAGHDQGFARMIMELEDCTALSRSVCPDDEKWRRVSRLRVWMVDRERSSVCPPWQSLPFLLRLDWGILLDWIMYGYCRLVV